MKFRVLLVLFFSVALLTPQRGKAEDGKAVIELLDRSQLVAADRLLAGLAEDDPWKAYAAAYMAYYRGDYAAARSLLPKGSTAAGEEGRQAALRLRIEAGWNATLGMLTRSLGNFRYRFRPGVDALLPEYAALALEAQREQLVGLLGELPESVLVEFYPDVESFVQASGLPLEWVKTTQTVAIAKWGRMLVLSPMNRAHGYPWLDTLAHEYVHLLLAQASGGRAPVWFHEGSAKLLEGMWRGAERGVGFLDPWAESLLAAAVEEGRLVSFAQMHPSMAALPSSEMASLAFAQVACALQLIFARIGDDGYRRVVAELASGRDLMAVLDRSLGGGEGGFEQHYRGHLKNLPLRRLAAVRELRFELEPGAAEVEDEDARQLDPVLFADRKMQDHTRLGDLLRVRGHREAALVEYRRAQAAGPFHSPALANKQARTLRSLGQLEDATLILEDSVSLYPEFTPTTTLLAEIVAVGGDDRRAVDLLLRSIALNPFNPAVHRMLEALFIRLGDQDGATREAAASGILQDWLRP